MASRSLLCITERGSGWSPRGSVGGGNFSGRIRCLNEIGSLVSECNHVSESAEM